MLILDSTPPSCWDSLVSSGGYLSHGADWQRLLENGLGCRSMYAWDERSRNGLALSIFKAGPFRVAYVGFPVGGRLRGPESAALDMPTLRQIYSKLGADVLRINVSAFEDSINLEGPGINTPETAICDLQQWSLISYPKLDRDVRKARRSEAAVVEDSRTNLGEAYFDLYRQTMRLNRGQLRYTPAYFHGLVDLAQRSSRLRCFNAFVAGRLAGFAVIALHRTSAYYLHGAIDRQHARQGITDLLLSRAIPWARQQGMLQFNLMTSPASQPSLVRYKEKWGAETRTHRTIEIAVRSARAHAFRLATQLHGLLMRGLT